MLVLLLSVLKLVMNTHTQIKNRSMFSFRQGTSNFPKSLLSDGSNGAEHVCSAIRYNTLSFLKNVAQSDLPILSSSVLLFEDYLGACLQLQPLHFNSVEVALF